MTILDPADLDGTIKQLAEQYGIDAETLETARRVIAFFPRPAQMRVDEANEILYQGLSLIDKFSFSDDDELILFTREPETIIDALIEMAMYLFGFATMIGAEEDWVVEFTIGAWKPVKNRIRRQLGLIVQEQPRGVVGLPPEDNAADPALYPFRTLVSHYDLGSFYQMVILAARDDIAVYFPPETHSKVLAVYVYMRRSMHEVAQGVGLKDHQTFNTRLLQSVHRLQNLFDPASLPPPGSAHLSENDSHPQLNNPFEEFIEQLFSDEEEADDSR